VTDLLRARLVVGVREEVYEEAGEIDLIAALRETDPTA
jgi:hypothetical protein